MSTPDLTPILEDLAAGRIDSAEASRRIEALTGAPAGASAGSSAGSTIGSTGTSAGAGADSSAAGERPRPRWQQYARDTFSRVVGDQPDTEADPRTAPPTAETPRTEGAEPPAGDDEVPTADRRTTNTKGVDRVSIRAVGRRVRVVGEPRVATASVDGAHVLRRNGSVLEISSDGEIGASIDGFTLLRPPRSLDDVRNLGLGKELFIRVNPNLIVDVELTAGSLTCEDVRYLGKVRVTAGGAKLTGLSEAHDVLVQAGQATVKGRIATGRSRIRCESGSLNVQLDDDSNVTVRAESQLGKVVWAGGHTGAGDEVVMGNGAARLDVGVVMGHAVVRVGTENGGDR
ncbi:hypothetical protein CGZ95_04895 [Enemella evansiae]|uniref:hypothetical protein n=1 Tax=Enemella evansiae TaxID=2016499 RepID=UPI000B962679|nr:hypothetical protein [Enemella evansiae]OYO03127.1 hypothetical protein CGZ95_04895 [Enemella evansiae]